MRIAFAIPGDLETLTGGYAYDRQLIAELRAAGHVVDVIGLSAAFPAPSDADLAQAAAAFDALPADCVALVDGLAFGAFPADLAASIRAPLVSLVHHPLALETGIAPDAAARLARMERAALAKVDGVIVTSAATRDTVVADYGVARDRITIAVPGLSPAWRGVERAPVDPPLIVSVGSVVPRKGYDVLLRALSQIVDMPWRAQIYGSLDRAPDTVAAVREAAGALSGRVELTGEASEDEIRAAFGAATLFALATRYEGFGMVFLEAMAAGLPVVATRGGAAGQVIPPGAGILADVDDASGVAHAIRRILTEPTLPATLSAGARSAGAAAQSWRETARQVAERLAAAAAGRS